VNAFEQKFKIEQEEKKRLQEQASTIPHEIARIHYHAVKAAKKIETLQKAQPQLVTSISEKIKELVETLNEYSAKIKSDGALYQKAIKARTKANKEPDQSNLEPVIKKDGMPVKAGMHFYCCCFIT